MKTTTHARLRRTAVETVASVPGIEAVVLFGSRARGTARATSDWDIAILSHASPEDERIAMELFDSLERVAPIVMNPDAIEVYCNRGMRLEAAVARQGKLIAGRWVRPHCRPGDLDVEPEDIGEHLETATHDLYSAFATLCNAMLDEHLYVPNVVEYSQQAAEALGKCIIAGFGLSPATVHDLNVLARQLEDAYRGRRREAEERRGFAEALRELDGNTRAAHKARYAGEPVEMPSRTARRLGHTMRLQTRWLRWYAERSPEMRGIAAKIEQAIATAADRIEELKGFGRVDPGLRAQVRAWGAEGGSIATAVGGAAPAR